MIKDMNSTAGCLSPLDYCTGNIFQFSQYLICSLHVGSDDSLSYDRADKSSADDEIASPPSQLYRL